MNSFREESVAAAATANAPNSDKIKMSRREKERDRFKKKNTTSTTATDSPGGTVDRAIPTSEASKDPEVIKGEAGPVKDVGTKAGSGGGGGGGGGGSGIHNGGKGHGGNKGSGGGKEGGGGGGGGSGGGRGGGKEGGGGGGGGAGTVGKVGGQSKSKKGPRDQSAPNRDPHAVGGKDDGRNRRGGNKGEKGAGVMSDTAPVVKATPTQIMKRSETVNSTPPTV